MILQNHPEADKALASIERKRFDSRIALLKTQYDRISKGEPTLFNDATVAAGLADAKGQPLKSGAVAWGDYDGDGFEDLLIDGRYVWRNKGDGTFEDVTWPTGTRTDNGWGCAWADFDRDGFMDLVVASGGQLSPSSGSGIRLFRNTGNSNHWLHIKLIGKDCNRAGIGARVTVSGANGKQIREVEGGAGTASQNSLEVEFGFGNSASPITVEIRWPCGKTQTLRGIKPDQKLTVTEE